MRSRFDKFQIYIVSTLPSQLKIVIPPFDRPKRDREEAGRGGVPSRCNSCPRLISLVAGESTTHGVSRVCAITCDNAVQFKSNQPRRSAEPNRAFFRRPATASSSWWRFSSRQRAPSTRDGETRTHDGYEHGHRKRWYSNFP